MLSAVGPSSQTVGSFSMHSTEMVGIMLLTSTLQSDLRKPAQVDSY